MSKLVVDSLDRTRIVGRKLLLTAELRERIVESIKIVRYLSVAAEACGIGRQTALKWMKMGELHELKAHPEMDDCTSHCEENDAAFRSFSTAIKKAKSEAIQEGLSRIQDHGKVNWQAQAWIEERTNPELFALRNKVEHTGEGGGPIIHKLLSSEQKQRMIQSAQESLTLEQNESGTFTVPDVEKNKGEESS